MRVLVTGASGFIGSHLTESMSNRGWEVHPWDLPQGDLTLGETEGNLQDYIHSSGIEVVVHLAALVGREFGEQHIEETISANSLMSARVARATSRAGARLVYCSTSEVYGDQGERSCHEWRDCRLPHNLYGLSKRWGEEVSALYAPRGLQVIRLSMPYGPGLPAGFGRAAIINMLWQAHHRYAIPVHRNARRAWCWIGDAIDGFCTVIASGERASSPRALANGIGVYNVGGEDGEVSMMRVAQISCEIAGAPTRLIELVDAPPNQTVVKRLSMAKLKGLGWKQTVSLREGMERTYEEVKTYPGKDG